MARDELEFSISQYLDGTLAEPDRIALEGRLAEDSEARALLAEDRALTGLLRSAPQPQVQWDRLADAISTAIDEQAQERMARASWWLRARVPVGLAAAASIFLAAALAMYYLLGPQTGPTGGSSPAVQPIATQLIVEGPQPDRPAGPVVSEISITAGAGSAQEPSLALYADEIDSRPSRVVIASGISPTQSPPPGFPY